MPCCSPSPGSRRIFWFHLLHGSTGLVSRSPWSAAPADSGPRSRWSRRSRSGGGGPIRFWLRVAAGARFSDLLTDLSYLAAASSLTSLGRLLLLPPPVLNLVGVVILLRGYRQASRSPLLENHVAARMDAKADLSCVRAVVAILFSWFDLRVVRLFMASSQRRHRQPAPAAVSAATRGSSSSAARSIAPAFKAIEDRAVDEAVAPAGGGRPRRRHRRRAAALRVLRPPGRRARGLRQVRRLGDSVPRRAGHRGHAQAPGRRREAAAGGGR